MRLKLAVDCFQQVELFIYGFSMGLEQF